MKDESPAYVRHEMQQGDEAPEGALNFRLAWNGRKWKPGRSLIQVADTTNGQKVPVLIFELVDIGSDEVPNAN